MMLSSKAALKKTEQFLRFLLIGFKTIEINLFFITMRTEKVEYRGINTIVFGMDNVK